MCNKSQVITCFHQISHFLSFLIWLLPPGGKFAQVDLPFSVKSWQSTNLHTSENVNLNLVQWNPWVLNASHKLIMGISKWQKKAKQQWVRYSGNFFFHNNCLAWCDFYLLSSFTLNTYTFLTKTNGAKYLDIALTRTQSYQAKNTVSNTWKMHYYN